MTEDHHENELGQGPLIPLTIQLDMGEELMAYTYDVEGHVDPALLCSAHYGEWVRAQPEWLLNLFAKINPTFYR